MFHNSKNQKKEEKICSIADFSSTSNFTQRQITAKVKDLVKESKKNFDNPYHKPVFIISPNLKAKHIHVLTQLFEQNNVPLQFQNQTDSLGLQLKTTFFIVADNKNGPLSLGKEFNSPLMTVVGYPKIGNNKKNIYCQDPAEVFKQYMEFINFKAKPQCNLEDKISQLKVQESMLQSGSNAFSMLRSEASGIKLKSISKYDRKNRQNSLTKASSNKKLFKNYQNKENLTSIHQIYNPHNLYFVESNENQQFNSFIGKIYNSLDLQKNNLSQKQSIFYSHSENDLIKKLNSILEMESETNNSKSSQGKKCHFIILSSNQALKMATRIQSEFYEFRNKIRFIVAMLRKQSSFDDENLQKQMMVIKKAIQSNLFQSVVTSPQECEKILKSIGYDLTNQNSSIKNYQNAENTMISKSKKELQESSRNKSFKSSEKLDDEISFCHPKIKNVDSNDEYRRNLTQKTQTPFKNQSKKNVSFKKISQLPYKDQEILTQDHLQIDKVETPAFSVVSPGKSTVSSTGSKLKIIKVLKKQPSSLNASTIESKNKGISEVNSQYCINKNRSIVEKFQQKIISSKRSLSSHKNIKSIQKSQNSKIINRIGSTLRPQYSSSKLKSITFIRTKSQKSIDKSNLNSVENQYGYENQPPKKKVKKLKMNLASEDPFEAQCSQVFLPNDMETFSTMSQRKQKPKKQASCIPFSANDYYFGSSIQPSNKESEVESHNFKQQNTIDGLLYIEYNEIISETTKKFIENCPSKIIRKNNIKPFYLACEYSRQLKKIWKNSKSRNILPVLIDTQGLTEIHKYYTDVMYEDDELQFYSTIEDQSSVMQQTGTFTESPKSSQNTPQLLLFFTIVSENQFNHSIFTQFTEISSRLPKHEVIKIIVKQELGDKQMKEKSTQIYNQMLDYFVNLGEQYGDKFVQTV